MMTMTASTASSPIRVKAPRTLSCVGHVDGDQGDRVPLGRRVVAIASTVRLLPVEDRLNRITPMVLNWPYRSARAALLGR